MTALSFCLRDSAALPPCTFGTQLNEILQSPLHIQSFAILNASAGSLSLFT